MTVVRELTGGIYFGERKEGGDTAYDTMIYSVEEIERIARFAGHLASQTNVPVTSIDKANVLASSRLWRSTVSRVFKEEFPNVPLHHQLVDSAALLMIKSPTVLNGVLLTENMFGDILSDEAAAIPGSLGHLLMINNRSHAFCLVECHDWKGVV